MLRFLDFGATIFKECFDLICVFLKRLVERLQWNSASSQHSFKFGLAFNDLTLLPPEKSVDICQLYCYPQRVVSENEDPYEDEVHQEVRKDPTFLERYRLVLELEPALHETFSDAFFQLFQKNIVHLMSN